MRRLLFLAAAALFAQDSTFVVDSKLVVVNVSVKDKSGKPITNLKKEDFQILEDVGGDARPFLDQTQEDVLRADMLVVSALRFLAGRQAKTWQPLP